MRQYDVMQGINEYAKVTHDRCIVIESKDHAGQ